MKRKRGFPFIFFVIIAGAVILLSGCKDKPTPEERLERFTKLWSEQKFGDMYEMLSESSRKSIFKEDFVERYKKIYKDLEVKDLQVKPVKVEEKDGKKEEKSVRLPFSVKMDTLAGEISFEHEASLVKEKRDDKEDWYIQWNTTYIFPNLQEGDKVRITTSKGERGEIFDRNGLPLAVNGSAFEIGLVPEQMQGNEAKIKGELAELLDVSVEKIDQALNASWVQPHFFVPIKKVARTETALIDKAKEIQGVSVREVSEREYPYGEAAAHLIGYIGEITAEELEKNKEKGYSAGDRIGKRGLEELFEYRLRGKNGAKIYIEKTDGSDVVLAEKAPEKGESITLTIDAELQKKIYEKMKGRKGSAAAIHPKTGEILALVSTPAFDPNAFVLGISSEKLKQLQEDKNTPLINRFASAYAPGSTIKPVVAAIGLETGTIDPKKKKKISGKTWRPDDPSWGNYSVTRVSTRLSEVDLKDALITSDNIYFAMSALEMGPDQLADGLKKFGFGEELKFGYPVQDSQISNSGTLKKGPQLADTGYGQGEMLMSILHLAAVYTPFINDGNMILPVIEQAKANTVWKEKVISKETADAVADMMKEVVASPYGTARGAYMKDLVLAGKTGTAELKAKKDEKGQENGFFVAYPAENPDLLIAMMIENVEKDGGSSYVVNKVAEIFKERQ